MSSEGDQSHAHAALLATRGSSTTAAINELQRAIEQPSLISEDAATVLLSTLSTALSNWDDENTAFVVGAVAEELIQGRPPSPIAVESWVRAHPNDGRNVRECIVTLPPKDVTIVSVLSRSGSQKVVFLATWHEAQREIVLKRPIGEGSEQLLINRELRPHPFSALSHPNIIETHVLLNANGDTFLAERRLSDVLNDDWRSRGTDEAANLLHDIAAALAHLHGNGLIHGDVKPDNIGYEDRRYILLDFGICRPLSDFSEATTATGSLRTRAPELFADDGKHNTASDVWALGATVFNAVVGRFPLFDATEKPPRISHPNERAEYESLLRERANTEWDERVVSGLAEVQHTGLKDLLTRCLDRDPTKRTSADKVESACREVLAAYIRRSDSPGRFSPAEEVAQLRNFLPDLSTLALMPYRKKTELQSRLRDLVAHPEINSDNLGSLAELLVEK